jgi:hypothetical protein
MIRFTPRWPFSFATSLAKVPRPSRSTIAALVCAAVALLSYLALVSYESTTPTPIWH